MKNKKIMILTALMLVFLVAAVLCAPFSMEIKKQASSFQSTAYIRFGEDMGLLEAVDRLGKAKPADSDTPSGESSLDSIAVQYASSLNEGDASAFKIRLVLFIACIILFIVCVALARKIRYLILVIGAVVMVFPFYWMITGSLKTLSETVIFPPSFTPANWLNFDNYVDAWTTSNVPFSTYYLNSIIVCAGSVASVMVTTVLAAYAFARLKFPGRDVLFTLLLSMMMVPFELLVITNSQTVVRLGMKNELISLIIPFISSIFYTYILRNFFMSVPDSLYSAATVDGCSNWSYLWKVMVPIAKPSLVTILLLNAMASWNSFMWPQMVISEPRMRTLPWGLTCFQTEAGAKDNVLMAAATLVVLPMLIMFLCARKQIVSGVSRGGIKG